MTECEEVIIKDTMSKYQIRKLIKTSEKRKKTVNSDSKSLKDIILIANQKNLSKRFEMVYDKLYSYLLNDLKTNNYCDFKDGKCIANRLRKTKRETNGCCYEYRKGLCREWDNGVCKADSITCKLFMCNYLKFQGIKYNLNDILFCYCFLNYKQKRILKISFFKPKSVILKRLVEAN